MQALFLILFFLPLGLDDYLIHLFTSSFVLALLALGWNILGGYAHQVSFGHAAFFGLGAYGAAILAHRGLDPWLALALGGVVSILGGALALPTLRLHGAYFALAMLAYAEVLRVVATVWEGVTGGAQGLLNLPSLHLPGVDFGSKIPNYFVALALLALGAFLAYRIRYGALGLGMATLSDEEAARSGGIPVFRLKVLALALSAFLAGLAGAFQALYVGFLEPPYAFNTEWSVFPLVASTIGGRGTVLGPILGTLGLYLGAELWIKPLLERGYHILTGVLVVLAVIALRKGFLGFLEDRYAPYRPRS
ncbi:branched-chain amino acid ABC transporter permease [Thermus thermophilus]|nr:branched-chain amino acid ABC transporter permease [Thermus thermophilus]